MVILNPADIKRIEWVKSFETGRKWFLKLRKQYGEKLGTQKVYAIALKRFCKKLGMNPDEIITQYKTDLDKSVHKAVDKWNEKVDLFIPWIVDNYKVGRVRAASHFTAIMSFFKYNVSIGLSAKTPRFHSGSILPVTREDLTEKILPFADITEKFITLFLKDSGMSQDDALRLNIGDIEDFGNGFGYVRTYRAKEGVDYETFVGPNTMDLMRKYIAFRRQRGFEVNDDSPLFVHKKKMAKRLSTRGIVGILWRLREKTGVKISSHRLRKFFETYLAIGKVHPIILKYWMGHKVKGGKTDIEGKYIIPPKPEQLKLYMEAYRNIDVTPKLDETEVLMAEIRTRMETLAPEQRKRFMNEMSTRYRSRIKAIMSDKRIKELLEETNVTQGGLAFDTTPQFIEINEDQLLSYLKTGWRITHNLQNGRVIIQRD
jgi:integrase